MDKFRSQISGQDIEAVLITSENAEDVARWCNGMIRSLITRPPDRDSSLRSVSEVVLGVVFRQFGTAAMADIGNWLVRFEKPVDHLNEEQWFVYMPFIFERLFDKYDGPPTT